MQKKILLSLLTISIFGIFLSTVVFFVIQTAAARESVDEMSIARLDDAEKHILSNNEKLEELIEIVREDNISRARALAMLIEMEPDIIEDNTKLEEIAVALDVDEIHIIDENGILRWGTQPYKYGMDFADGEQTRPFLAILDDPTIEISQVPMTDSSLGVIRQYAGVSLRHTKGIAEVGVIPIRMLDALENAHIDNILQDLTLGNTGYLFSISTETGLISSHPDPGMVGVRLPEQPQGSGFMNVNGENIRYHTRSTSEEILATAFPTAEMYEQRTLSTGFFLLFIIILFILFCGIINTYIKRNVVTGIYSILGILDKITEGDLDTTADVRSSTEFNRLSDGINHMLSSIKAMIAEVSEAVTVAEEASKSKSTFLANMSHEIRTPMNAIIGMTDLLLNEQLSSRQQSYVNDINVSSHALLSIINDILDLSKIEAGKMELTPVDYNFQAFIDNMGSVCRFLVQKKNLEFKFEIIGDLPKCLYGDDIRLRQVLTNICGNAAKFTSEGFVRLKIIIEDNVITFEIADSGMGIRKSDLSGLFDAFSQADTRKNRNVTGTGLGLPISKSFVEMMGGSITVNSEYGKGSVFAIIIPKVLGNESAIRSVDVQNKKAFFASTAKVLVVDDNEVNLRVASGLLNLYKIDAVTALSGKEAISLIKETDYDIVFMDHMMPEMDGVETTHEIRKLGGKYEHLTIIALTANAIHGAREMFIANGFNGFISKPIEMDELIEILKEWLPSEKLQSQTETAVPSENQNSKTQNDFIDSIKKISGMDPELGLSRLSGLEDMYRETVDLFCKKMLGECNKMNGFLTDSDLHNLSISVHGMKSSLSTIGAMELSETAAQLEKASKNDDLDYCAEHFPGFLAKLHALHEQLAGIFPSEEASLPRPAGNDEYLQKYVQKALDAANDFEGDLASQAMSKLLEYDFGEELNTLLKNANNAIKDFDFDATVGLLNEIIAT